MWHILDVFSVKKRFIQALIVRINGFFINQRIFGVLQSTDFLSVWDVLSFEFLATKSLSETFFRDKVDSNVVLIAVLGISHMAPTGEVCYRGVIEFEFSTSWNFSGIASDKRNRLLCFLYLNKETDKHKVSLLDTSSGWAALLPHIWETRWHVNRIYERFIKNWNHLDIVP